MWLILNFSTKQHLWWDRISIKLIIIQLNFRSLGFRLGLQSVTGVLTSLFFLGLFYRSASLYHPQRRAILHLKDMSKRKGKDKNKMENKPPYFDLTTLKAKPFHFVLLSTAFTAFGIYTPLFFFVSILALNKHFLFSHNYTHVYRFRTKWPNPCAHQG